MPQHETRICLDCKKERTILKSSYPSNYCRACSLKLENKIFQWYKVKEYLAKEYKRGLKDGRKQMRRRLFAFVLKEFPYLRNDTKTGLSNFFVNRVYAGSQCGIFLQWFN